jgi:hypothetical protein
MERTTINYPLTAVPTLRLNAFLPKIVGSLNCNDGNEADTEYLTGRTCRTNFPVNVRK